MSTTDADGLVWHYTDAGGLLGIIQGKQLWATHFQFMNDTLEGALMADPLDKFIADDDVLNSYEREMVKIMNQQYEGISRLKITRVPDGNHFLLCGSEKGDELTLWRNYAQGSVSFAIGLDPKCPLGVIPPRNSLTSSGRVQPWNKVDYREQDSELPDEYAARIRSAAQNTDKGDQIGDLSAALQYMYSQVKSSAFKDERETRVVCQTDNPDMWRFRAGQYGITPYVALGTANAWGENSPGDEPLPIRAIRLSANATPPDHLALNALLESHGFGGDAEIEEFMDHSGSIVDTYAREYEPPVQLIQATNSLRN
ncbi:DUF2971 domain-containing protein [Brevibacterium sp. RIT 803]|uniref:DUF2971 domain-containing protein n=1 Tax=Brevibacterium sp. RIT 803 TaxID=2810210 RepID=UPI0019503B7A|nr:DUF2971 domain-containing protein [Brevibacterium sp. RIT 803]MBM6588946.1 DUF2971 domain-containing protein [Brevibacterium sp. RIT 803]